MTNSDTSAGSGGAREDSEWGPDSEEECSCNNEIQTSNSEVNEDSNTVATSINLNDGELCELVTRLIQEDPCNKKCLKGKAMELEQFLCSLSQMTSGEKKQIIKPTLAVLKKTDTVLRHRDHGLREQFNFYLPLIGQNVSNGVVQLLRDIDCYGYTLQEAY
ncbi:hypothetical protein F441_21972 [Phytophthora nicotianae CJ01A1]|uniref:Uncharacterized protein n=3 Tax=Phytophthora nicotianae TaxID=4792 RepID=W2VR05_PHYNI|nr:hypothetical protein L916_21347 [Phytophthora nicotianae]ETO59575.1 hypothetical protein F444_22097 [Phytophthora nicotianae P1976]ETP00646.1 hypothetical protein F441_21972 [Phytophthora nicotianae CJ01A1]